MRDICRTALRSPQFTHHNWMIMGGRGREEEGMCVLMASGKDLKVNLQTVEILWRNDDLRPVPDSMTQYADYEALFGRDSKQCGIVSKQAHRLWVHLVGR